jgi:hypothetical protein
MALQHEEFQNEMVYLLLFGARRCLSFELGTIGEMLGHGSYVKIYSYGCNRFGYGKMRFACMMVLAYDYQGDCQQQHGEDTFWHPKWV